MEELAALVEANEDVAAAIAAAHQILLGGVPNQAGFTFLINNAVDTNFGTNDDSIVFNQENTFINIANSLVQGNPDAAAAFAAITAGSATLTDQVTALYNAIVPLGAQSPEGLAFITRPEALQFYMDVAAQRGVAGPDGAAIVALASLMNIAVQQDISGLGDSVNDLIAAIENGSADLPADGDDFIPIETADGTQFDADDNADSTPIALTAETDLPGAVNAGVDTAGSDFDDTYTANENTLTAGDIIDGNGGFDDLALNFFDVKFTLGDVGGAYVPGTGFLGLSIDLPAFEVESTELERIEVQMQGGNDIIDQIISAIPAIPPADLSTIELISGAQIDVSRSTDLQQLGINRTGGIVAFESIQNNVLVDITDSTGLFAFVFDTDALGAAPATFDLTIEDVYAVVLVEAQGGETFGSLVLHTTGSNILMFSDNFDGSAPLTSLTVDGDGANILVSGLLDPDLAALVGGDYIADEFAGVTTVDLTGNSGGTFLELFSNREDVTYDGGSGNDLTLFGLFETDFSGPADGALTDDDIVDGNAGYDGLLMSGLDWQNLSADHQISDVEFYGILTPGDGNPFKFENSDHDVDVGLFVDQGAGVTLEDMDGHTLFVLTSLGSTIAFDDTDDAVITLGLPADFANYVDVLSDAFDELGLDVILPFLASFPIPFTTVLSDVEVLDTDTLTLNVGLPSAIPFTQATLQIDNIDVDGSLSTIIASGPGSLILGAITPVTAPDDFAITFDLTDLSGGFSNSGFGLDEAQTFILGSLGNIDGLAVGDFDDDGAPDLPDDDSSVIELGAADIFSDTVVFTAAGFSNVAIVDFAGWNANPVLGQQDILDFSALGVNELSDLNIADNGLGEAIITSDLFDGTVLLVGVSAADLSNENFDFVV